MVLLFWILGFDSDPPPPGNKWVEIPLEAFGKMVLHNPRWEKVRLNQVQHELRREQARIARYEQAFRDALKRKSMDPDEESVDEADFYVDMPGLADMDESSTQSRVTRPVPCLSTHPFSTDSDAITTAVVDLEQRMRTRDTSKMGKASAVQASLVHLPPLIGWNSPFSIRCALLLSLLVSDWGGTGWEDKDDRGRHRLAEPLEGGPRA